MNIVPHAVTNAGLRCGGGRKLYNLVANVLYPMSTQCLLYRKTCGRLVEDLPRLVNDIRYDSFIIVGLRGKLQKASDYFLFSREKIKELILLSYPVFFKCQTRLLWSSFLTMSFFSKRGKKTC